MGHIKVLDCTLRDGGYCNQWNFKFENIKKIINHLVLANVDIVECGFLTNKCEYRKDISKYTNLQEVARFIPKDKRGKIFVCLMNYGEYNIDDLPEYDGTSIDGIRVAFHKKDFIPALNLCRKIKEKGYKVFIQAMVSLNYSDEEFLKMIRICNQFVPYAFYIVDSFGVMKRKDLRRLFYVVEHNLDESVCIGFHSHNNLQLSYSNAQALVDIKTKRKLIIDSSVMGMGRGAGNLNTELFLGYLNDSEGTSYDVKPVLNIIDEILNGFYQKNYWGYSLPNYLSATHNAHPNYADYLDSKKTLTAENIDEIFAMMSDEKKSEFDKGYIESLYISYMAKGQIQETNMTDFKKYIGSKKVFIIAPGKSSVEERSKIIEFAKNDDVVTISVNFEYKGCETDFVFLSNLRRYREFDSSCSHKMIVTANIPIINTYLQIRYVDLLNSIDAVRDNATMMLIKFLIDMGVKEIFLAGLDGYSTYSEQNFANSNMAFVTQKAKFEAMNDGMNKILHEYSRQVSISFVTTPRYVNI